LAYFLGRTTGKMLGAFIGASISGAPKNVRKYLPLCLFSQAGVAIGLSIVASHIFPEELGSMIVVIVTTTTFIVQLIGPICTRIAIHKAAETGLNLTEEDILNSTTISEIIQEAAPLINEKQPLSEIIQLFTKTNDLEYPVVDKNNTFCGIVTVQNIKQLLLETNSPGLILAHDIMEESKVSLEESCFLSDVLSIMKRGNLGYIPILNKNKKVLSIVKREDIDRFVSTKLIALKHSDV
jgi:predicted transcriptional regulator